VLGKTYTTMRKYILVLITILFFGYSYAQKDNSSIEKRIQSTIDSTYNNEIVLIQEFIINVPLDSVWNAFTTKKGWESAFVAISEVDLKVGGTIKSSYNKNATIGDSTTIVNHIVNYVPKKILTLQPEVSENFPEFMKKEAKDFYNVIYFREFSKNKTKVESYGIGYKNTPKYLSLLKFFILANEKSYLNLIKYLETGVKVKY